MYTRLCAVFILTQILGAPAFAAGERHPPPGGGGLFEGTPEEQAACAPDASRFCQDKMPDSLRVLSCLQEHRQKLRKVCEKVLENHGR